MRILLTGQEGFIGSNILKSLGSHEVIIIEKDFWNRITSEELNCLVSTSDVVLHIGAIADTTTKNEADLLYYNYTTTKKLFDICNKYNKKVVFASSAAIMGTHGTPSNLYGWTKYMVEKYAAELKMDFVALRYFNVYGPGEEHKSTMASVAYQAYKAGKFKLYRGNPERDFVYIEDVVDATIKAIDVPSGIYEVASGKSERFEEVLKYMEIPYIYRDDPPPFGYQFITQSYPDNWLPDWKPKFNLEQGIKKYKEYLDEV